MATATKIVLTSNEELSYAVKALRKDSALKASELLNENHKNHDIYINDLGHHNHILHHILTLYALGASPEQLEAAYNEDRPGQRPAFPPHQPIIRELQTPAGFAKYLGDYTQYSNYLVHFENEIEAKGSDRVVAEYVFANDHRANDLLARHFTGFAHAGIHLGYGLEFKQPAIVAEALAQACVHEGWGLDFFLAAEKAGDAQKQAVSDNVSLLRLYDETRGVIEEMGPVAAKYEYYDNCVKYGIVHVAAERLLPVLSQWVVNSDNLAEKTAEMIDAAVYFCVTAQRAEHIQKLDFFYLHSTTLSVHFTAFLNHPALSTEARIRFLEWKGRWDLANYASRGAAPLHKEELTDYVPKKPVQGWQDIFNRVDAFVHPEDSGHAPKMIRGIANGWKTCEKVDRSRFGLKDEGTWLKAAALCMDSFEGEGPLWVRGAGFDKGWAPVPLRK